MTAAIVRWWRRIFAGEPYDERRDSTVQEIRTITEPLERLVKHGGRGPIDGVFLADPRRKEDAR